MLPSASRHLAPPLSLPVCLCLSASASSAFCSASLPHARTHSLTHSGLGLRHGTTGTVSPTGDSLIFARVAFQLRSAQLGRLERRPGHYAASSRTALPRRCNWIPFPAALDHYLPPRRLDLGIVPYVVVGVRVAGRATAPRSRGVQPFALPSGARARVRGDGCHHGLMGQPDAVM
jgi:hypothetical protein